MTVKRLFDLAIALPAAIATAPLVAGLAAAVKLSSPGPAFFAQTRVGLRRRPIRVLKLRTMVDGADKKGPAVTAGGDSRITPLGALLRKTKLDELPQLWNVVRGDMSLVGPRPEAPRYVERYRPEWEALFSVRPGITDEASLVFRDEESLLAGVPGEDREQAYIEAVLPAKLALALEGVERDSLLYSAGVLARTALAVLRPARLAEHPALVRARGEIARLARG
jgi:lipopolysaccharide/colanic/teichoic acid biosynthesis glycosyltransferase